MSAAFCIVQLGTVLSKAFSLNGAWISRKYKTSLGILHEPHHEQTSKIFFNIYFIKLLISFSVMYKM